MIEKKKGKIMQAKEMEEGIEEGGIEKERKVKAQMVKPPLTSKTAPLM